MDGVSDGQPQSVLCMGQSRKAPYVIAVEDRAVFRLRVLFQVDQSIPASLDPRVGITSKS